MRHVVRNPLIPRTLQDTILSQTSFRQYRQSSPLLSLYSPDPWLLAKITINMTVLVNGSRRWWDYSLMSASGMPRRHTQPDNHSHRMLPSRLLGCCPPGSTTVAARTWITSHWSPARVDGLCADAGQVSSRNQVAALALHALQRLLVPWVVHRPQSCSLLGSQRIIWEDYWWTDSLHSCRIQPKGSNVGWNVNYVNVFIPAWTVPPIYHSLRREHVKFTQSPEAIGVKVLRPTWFEDETVARAPPPNWPMASAPYIGSDYLCERKRPRFENNQPSQPWKRSQLEDYYPLRHGSATEHTFASKPPLMFHS